MRGERPKILFANQLRGVAVLLVLLVHYTIVAQSMRRDVAWVVAAPAIDTPFAPIAAWLNFSRFDLGAFAVALFFLISGFVIPFALEATSAPRFLLARALRIYPVFWLALALDWAAVSASAAYWHAWPAYGLRSYVVNGLLVETALGEQTVDWVSWTLSVEVKFYLLAAALRPLVLRRRVWPLLVVAGVALTLNTLAAQGALHLPVELVSEATYLAFIGIGVLFHYRHCRALGRKRLAVCAGLLMAVVAASWAVGPMLGDWRVKTASMAAALACFAAAYAARGRFRRNAVLDACAAISYPLYLVHAVFGFTVMSFLIMAWRLPYEVAAVAALAAAAAAAYALHRLAERPCIRLGGWVARRGSGDGVEVAPLAAPVPGVASPAA